jgi:hypothetical protein
MIAKTFLKGNAQQNGRDALTPPIRFVILIAVAEVVELVDTLRSGRSGGDPVGVQIPPSAPVYTLQIPFVSSGCSRHWVLNRFCSRDGACFSAGSAAARTESQ